MQEGEQMTRQRQSKRKFKCAERLLHASCRYGDEAEESVDEATLPCVFLTRN